MSSFKKHFLLCLRVSRKPPEGPLLHDCLLKFVEPASRLGFSGILESHPPFSEILLLVLVKIKKNNNKAKIQGQC